MKKVAYLLLLISYGVFGQASTTADETHTFDTTTSDTTYYEYLWGKSEKPSMISFDFSGMSNDSVQLSLFYVIVTSSFDTIPLLADNVGSFSGITFPLNISKTTYSRRWRGKTWNAIGFNTRNWTGDRIGYEIIRNSATGTIIRSVNR